MDGEGTSVCRRAGKSILILLPVDSAPSVAISFTCTVGFTDPAVAVTLTRTGSRGSRCSTHGVLLGQSVYGEMKPRARHTGFP